MIFATNIQKGKKSPELPISKPGIVKGEVYTFLKKIMGPVSLHVHDKCLYSATVVPRDQNMVEIVLPPVESFRPDFFLTLFAVHADFQGYGQDLSKLKETRLTGNPCM